MAGESRLEHRNEVHLVGEVAQAPEERELPSGDVVVSVRLRVRAPAAGPGAAPPRAEAVVCAAWSAVLRRRLLTLARGDTVEVTGSLHRRFWRASGAPASTHEVVLSGARRLARAPVPA